jgi:hypothetical protein
MPVRGAWYCQGCIENPALLQAAAQRNVACGPAAYVNGRSRLPRRLRGPDEWVGVWQSVWDRLHFDVEFPFEEDNQSETMSEQARREEREWNYRFELARRLGAGTRFRAAADNIHTTRPHNHSTRARSVNKTLHQDVPKSPDPESQEELRAWNAFEKAREQVAEAEGHSPPNPASNGNNRRRKRKSVDSSPEPDVEERQPERKLKRPRTRLVVDTAESSTTAARRNTLTHASPPNGTTGDSSTGPGFLQSILQEVAVKRFTDVAAPQPRRVIVERACSSPHSSPGLSPVYTRVGMTTPPPLTIHRTDSPTRQSGQDSPTYSPYSPADDEVRPGRRQLAFRPHSPQLSSPPHSNESSPTRSSKLSYSTKAELQRMVTAVLKPIYVKKDISKDVYTEVNRDVSRLLYERVGDAGPDALADQPTRKKWQKMASDEVENAIKLHNSNHLGSLPVADDSASSSS